MPGELPRSNSTIGLGGGEGGVEGWGRVGGEMGNSRGLGRYAAWRGFVVATLKAILTACDDRSGGEERRRRHGRGWEARMEDIERDKAMGVSRRPGSGGAKRISIVTGREDEEAGGRGKGDDWRGKGGEEWGGWQPLRLAALAEVALAEGIAAAKHCRLAARCEEMDRLYFSLNLGPGLLAMNLAAEMRAMQFLAPDNLMDLALHLERLALEEPAFHCALRAVASGRLNAANFDDVIRMVFRGHGAESVNVRFARLATAVKSAHLMVAEVEEVEGGGGGALQSSYIAEFADAVLRSGAMREHPWAYEMTLNFLRMNSRGRAMEGRERDLRAQILLNKWRGGAKGRGRGANGEGAEDWEALAIERIERMNDPAVDVGWHVWLRIGKLLEMEYDVPLLLESMHVQSLLHTYDRIGIDGKHEDEVEGRVFSWGLSGLHSSLSPSDPASSLLEIIFPHEEDRPDIALAIAARMCPSSSSSSHPPPPASSSSSTSSSSSFAYSSTSSFCGSGMNCGSSTSDTGATYEWPNFGERAAFIAQLLCLAEEGGQLSPEQMRRAVAIASRVWGWAMPKPNQLAEQCETEEEAEELRERSACAIWRSVAASGASPVP